MHVLPHVSVDIAGSKVHLGRQHQLHIGRRHREHIQVVLVRHIGNATRGNDYWEAFGYTIACSGSS